MNKLQKVLFLCIGLAVVGSDIAYGMEDVTYESNGYKAIISDPNNGFIHKTKIKVEKDGKIIELNFPSYLKAYEIYFHPSFNIAFVSCSNSTINKVFNDMTEYYILYTPSVLCFNLNNGEQIGENLEFPKEWDLRYLKEPVVLFIDNNRFIVVAYKATLVVMKIQNDDGTMCFVDYVRYIAGAWEEGDEIIKRSSEISLHENELKFKVVKWHDRFPGNLYTEDKSIEL